AASRRGSATHPRPPDVFARTAEYDALFMREKAGPTHPAYGSARRAVSEGLVVIDEPESIVKCTNKVYLAELLNRHEVPTPKTLVVHRENVGAIGGELGFPCVLKNTASAFSMGGVKAESGATLDGRRCRCLGG